MIRVIVNTSNTRHVNGKKSTHLIFSALFQLSEVVLPFQKYKTEEVFMSKDPEDLLTVSNATEASKGLERQEPTALETVGATHTCLPVQVRRDDKMITIA